MPTTMRRLLIVEDDDTMRDVLHDALSNVYNCHSAKTAERALVLIDQGTYELVLTDISLPGLGGLELLSRVRHKHPETMVILMSGITDNEYISGAMRMGAQDYIKKPFTIEEIVKALAHTNNQETTLV
jgi:DNA-binding NtrC family response regulator